MTPTTDIVSVISASNETGIINDIPEICAQVKQKNPECMFHSDCAQSYIKAPLKYTQIDVMTLCL